MTEERRYALYTGQEDCPHCKQRLTGNVIRGPEDRGPVYHEHCFAELGLLNDDEDDRGGALPNG